MKAKLVYCENHWLRNYFAAPYHFHPHQKPISFSKKFCEFFSENLDAQFVKITGILPSTKVTITRPNRDDSPQIYEQGIVSRINPVLWILPDYHDDISFCWKSKTGKIIKPTDEDFDVDDLECWVENLKPAEYWKQIGTAKKQHPFQSLKLSFELVVFEFGIETDLKIYCNPGTDHSVIRTAINDTIERFNSKSESLGRRYGVVHNYKFLSENDTTIVRIDTGSAGVGISKAILKALKKCEGIYKVEMDI